MNVIRLHDAQSGTADGYSVPGKLSEEFSIKTRTEGYFSRQSVNKYRVPRSQGQTSRDIVQAVESELYLFDRLVDTVSDKALQTEMRLNDGEKLRILLLSVDDSTRQYLQLHAGDSYSECQRAGGLFCDVLCTRRTLNSNHLNGNFGGVQDPVEHFRCAKPTSKTGGW